MRDTEEQIVLLTIRDVVGRTKICRSTIYEWMRAGRFPKALTISEKIVRWRADEVEAWIKDQPRAA